MPDVDRRMHVARGIEGPAQGAQSARPGVGLGRRLDGQAGEGAIDLFEIAVLTCAEGLLGPGPSGICLCLAHAGWRRGSGAAADNIIAMAEPRRRGSASTSS